MYSLSARWVFPVVGPPLRDGVVVIDDGIIQTVEPAGSRCPDEYLSHFALLPALVNAHTHLDLTDALNKTAPKPGQPFPDWLERVIAFRRQQTTEQLHAAYRQGLEQSLRFGVGCVGDIWGGADWPPTIEAIPVQVVSFREVLGLRRERAPAAIEQAEAWLQAARQRGVTVGISPHAPYSVSQELLQRCATTSQRWGIPLAVHLAESPEEISLLEHQTGPMVPFLERLGVYDAEGLASSAPAVIDAVAAAVRLLFIHGNQLAEGTVFPSRSTMVVCPRTHARFWPERRHPIVEFWRRGCNIALGTDSLASNPDLDLLAEACHIRQNYPEIAAKSLLEMITYNGSKALGQEAHFGQLAPGRPAHLFGLPLADGEASDPHELLFRPEILSAPRRLHIAGNWL